MGEHLQVGISDKLRALVEKARGEKKPRDNEDAPIGEKKKNILEWALTAAATRIVLARDVGELSVQLKDIQSSLAGGKDTAEVDRLRAAVMDKMDELVHGEDLIEANTAMKGYIYSGKVGDAVALLEKMAKQDRYKLTTAQHKEVDELLGSVKDLDTEKSANDAVIEAKIKQVEQKGGALSKTVDKELTSIRDSSNEIETSVSAKNLENEKLKLIPKKLTKKKIEIKQAEVVEIAQQADKVADKHDKATKHDNRFIKKLLEGGNDGFGVVDASGNLVIEIDKLSHPKAEYLYGRVSTALGRYQSKLGSPDNAELKAYLEEVEFELRGRLHDLEDIDREKWRVEGKTEDEMKWEKLPAIEKSRIIENFDFIDKNMSAEQMLQHAMRERQNQGISMKRSEVALQNLLREHPEIRAKFNEKGEWVGTAEEFFELCRLEIYKIRDSVPEERLGNLVFEETADIYLALMGISTKNNPELKNMKDAVTKTLYLEFVVKSLWKAGGNHEAWQRAAALILREGADTNFFLTMKVREKLRGKDKRGNDIPPLPGFNIDDMMTLGELRAPNGQSWLAYISTNNIQLNESRLQEMGNALAKLTLEKAKLRKNKDRKMEISSADYSTYLAMLTNKEIKFDKEQLDWVRNYMQYIHVATLNVGEKLWLMDGTVPGRKGFDYASLPGGQFAQKSGLWPILYFAKYNVTKYGFEGLGKLFIPNPGLLSYARGETLRHFMSANGSEDWLRDPEGDLYKPGGGARDFFFEGKTKTDQEMKVFTDFWEEIWLDSRTGTSFKSKGMRSLQNSRDVGMELIKLNKHKDFIDDMKFDQLERLVGHEIPGATNEEKLTWVVGNLDYDMMEMSTMPSKREGDWVNKYSKIYVETVKAFQDFLDAPTLTNKMKIITSVAQYNSEAVSNLSKQLNDFIENKSKYKIGLLKRKNPKTGQIELGNPLNPFHWIGPKTVSDDQKDLVRSADGDNMEMPVMGKSATDGWYLGRGLKFSLEEAKEGRRNPMVMKKIEIQNEIAWGIVSPQEGGQKMRDWQKMIYFGDQIVLGKLKLRPGMIPFLTPYFLLRGYWVDRMGFDWEDFKMIMAKQNEETWEKLKKLLGIEI